MNTPTRIRAALAVAAIVVLASGCASNDASSQPTTTEAQAAATEAAPTTSAESSPTTEPEPVEPTGIRTAPCTVQGNASPEMIDYLLPAESGAVCEEFSLKLVSVPDVDVKYISSVTHVHAFTHEGWQVPEGATSMTIRAVATTEHPGALPNFDEQVAQLEAAGWVRMQTCAPPLYDTTPMAYFEPRDGWDLTLISTPPSIASYNVSDYGVAANSCHR